MTTLTANYNFMDLLKDYNYVPKIDRSSNSIVGDVKRVYERVTETTSDYSFMDLLKDKGQVPEVAVQEMSILNEIENSIESIIEFVEESADYTVIDLLKEKRHAQTPVPANDNGHYIRQAS